VCAVGHETVPSRLPPGALDGLREAFAAEVRERLPRLVSLSDPDAARRDAHTLASSAWVVGESQIATLARAVEDQFPGGPLPELVAALQDYLVQAAP
jgi:HPt (histidine-containing phosphotransfer) domain-containing protein